MKQSEKTLPRRSSYSELEEVRLNVYDLVPLIFENNSLSLQPINVDLIQLLSGPIRARSPPHWSRSLRPRILLWRTRHHRNWDIHHETSSRYSWYCIEGVNCHGEDKDDRD
jgi:hypothetical protein